MPDRQNGDGLFSNRVDDSVLSELEFTDLRPSHLRNHSSGLGKSLQFLDVPKQFVDPTACRRRVVLFDISRGLANAIEGQWSPPDR